MSESQPAEGATENTPQYHVVILSSEGDIDKQSFNTRDELVAKLKSLINLDVSVVCFRGSFLPISKPPLRYLMDSGENIPLWEPPEEIEEDLGVHYMGVDPILLEPPAEIRPPAEQTTDADEFFSDAADDISTIFDAPLPDPDA